MKALIFDSGGVLIRPDSLVIAERAAKLGISVAPEQVIRAIHRADRRRDVGDDQGRTFTAYWAEEVGCSVDLSVALWDGVLASLPATELWNVPNKDAENYLAALDRGIPRVVVTNSEGDAHHELRLSGLRDLVDGVLDSTQVGICKPDPRIFHMAAVAMAVQLEDCIYISDTLDAPDDVAMRQVLYDPCDVYADAGPLPVWKRVTSLVDLLGQTLFGTEHGHV